MEVTVAGWVSERAVASAGDSVEALAMEWDSVRDVAWVQVWVATSVEELAVVWVAAEASEWAVASVKVSAVVWAPVWVAASLTTRRTVRGTGSSTR